MVSSPVGIQPLDFLESPEQAWDDLCSTCPNGCHSERLTEDSLEEFESVDVLVWDLILDTWWEWLVEYLPSKQLDGGLSFDTASSWFLEWEECLPGSQAPGWPPC